MKLFWLVKDRLIEYIFRLQVAADTRDRVLSHISVSRIDRGEQVSGGSDQLHFGVMQFSSIKSIMSDQQLTPQTKKNLFLSTIRVSVLQTEEIRSLLSYLNQNDSVLSDRIVYLLYSHAMGNEQVFSELINILRVSVNFYTIKAVLIIASRVSNNPTKEQTKLLRDAWPLVLVALRSSQDPYDASNVQTAQEMLCKLVSSDQRLLDQLCSEIDRETSPVFKSRLMLVLEMVAIRNASLKKTIAEWLLTHCGRTSDLEERLANIEPKTDPKSFSDDNPGVARWFLDRIRFAHLGVIAILEICILLSVREGISRKEIDPNAIGLIVRNDAFLVGIMVTILVFALREVYSKYSADVLRVFLLNKVRLVCVVLVFGFFFLVLFVQSNAAPTLLVRICITSLYLVPLLFLVWCLSLLASLLPRSILKSFVIYHLRNVMRLAKLEAVLSKRLEKFRDSKLKFKYIFQEIETNPTRNRTIIVADRDGIVTDLNSQALIEVDAFLTQRNESHSFYGKGRSLAEVQILKRVGTVVDKGEELAALYADDLSTLDRTRRLVSKMYNLSANRAFVKFKDLVDSLFQLLNNSLRNIDISSSKYILNLLLGVWWVILSRKKYEINLQYSPKTLPKFSLLEENEVVILEIYLLKGLTQVAKVAYLSGIPEQVNQFDFFFGRLLLFARSTKLYTTSHLVLSTVNDMTDHLLEGRHYASLRRAFILRASLARDFYQSDESSNDTELRLHFEGDLDSILARLDEDQELKKHIHNYFTSYQTFLFNVLVTKYFNATSILKSLDWMEKSSTRYKSSPRISFLFTETLFLLGSLALSRDRYFLAFRISTSLTQSEQSCGVSVERVFNALKKRKYDLRLSNSLLGGIFGPGQIDTYLVNYAEFFSKAKSRVVETSVNSRLSNNEIEAAR